MHSTNATDAKIPNPERTIRRVYYFVDQVRGSYQACTYLRSHYVELYRGTQKDALFDAKKTPSKTHIETHICGSFCESLLCRLQYKSYTKMTHIGTHKCMSHCGSLFGSFLRQKVRLFMSQDIMTHNDSFCTYRLGKIHVPNLSSIYILKYV